MQKLIAFLRLSRPTFLLGGAVLYALGAAVARYLGQPLRWDLYLAGQLGVTSVQIMTHYLNEYRDVETDRLNANRTPWSGGSGVLAEGRLARRTALHAAIVSAGAAMLALTLLIARFGAGPAAVLIFLLAFLGSFFYSTPPVHLAASGYGEFTCALIVAGLSPMFSYLLQTRSVDPLVLLASLPLVLLSFAMLLAFEFPDYLSDEAAGKRTLLVRLGRRAGRRLHAALLLAAFLALAPGVWLGLPGRVALGALIALPLAALQLWQGSRMARGIEIPWAQWTFAALALFAVTAYLLAVGFWTLG